MLKWLQDNRQWIFDGIGVAAILAIAGAIAALIRLFFVMRKVSNQPKEIAIQNERETEFDEIKPLTYLPPIEQRGESHKGHVVNIVGHTGPVTVGDVHHPETQKPSVDLAGRAITPARPPPPAPALTPPPQAKTITALEVFEAIESVPLFQRDEIAEFYKDQPIDWNCWLSIVHKQRDNPMVGVVLNSVKGRYAHCNCEVLLAHYPQLKLMNSDHPVRIIGVVEHATAYDIAVRDAVLYF